MTTGCKVPDAIDDPYGADEVWQILNSFSLLLVYYISVSNG